MAALLYLRRRAAAAALAGVAPKPQWLATAARRGALVSGDDGGETGERGKSPWLQLPPFAPLDAAAAARAISRGGGEGGDGEQGATAIKWVRRCCPDLPTSLVQKLFRLRKVKKNVVTAEISSADASAEQHRLRRVSAKDQLMPGDILFLPVNLKESSVAEKTKKFDNRNEINFLRGLEIYKDEAIIVVNKPPGMPVQGGVGIKNSIDVLASMFEENSSEAPRLVHRLDRDCSGILVLGRNQLSTSMLHAIFREKTADALADILLQDGKSERLTIRASSNAASVQDALTEYRVIESCPQGYTWLELFPRTGRKHQRFLEPQLLGITSMDGKRIRSGCLFPCHGQLMRNCSGKGSFPLGLLWVAEASLRSNLSFIYTASKWFFLMSQWLFIGCSLQTLILISQILRSSTLLLHCRCICG
ncbi:RNA pseudouridine synthase 4, mitochondrial isoform X3 [Oryza sativa Japonica Group]|uniref:RNA pseudouridine synthase 4, mitochondrial isoform X3 n=1 Tax=Oryza sativa subsp. japonica TaxID=39947 RepID=UPI00339CAAB7